MGRQVKTRVKKRNWKKLLDGDESEWETFTVWELEHVLRVLGSDLNLLLKPIGGTEKMQHSTPDPRIGTDSVAHPAHYNTGKIEVIEFLEDQRLGFHLGNVVKYVARAGKKDESKIVEDLEKARWYLDRKIEILKAAQDNRPAVRPNDMAKAEATETEIQPKPTEVRHAGRFMTAYMDNEFTLSTQEKRFHPDAGLKFVAACQNWMDKYAAEFELTGRVPPPPCLQDYETMSSVSIGGSTDGKKIKPRGKRATSVRRKSKTKAARSRKSQVRSGNNGQGQNPGRSTKSSSEARAIARESGGPRI